jgi:hypothetical protein
VVGKAQADRGKALQVKILDVRWRGFQDDLQLMVFKKAIRILAVASVGGPTRRLDVHNLIRPGTQHAKECFRVHGPCPNFDVIRLLNDASVIAPVLLQLKDEVLKGGPFKYLMFFFNF